MSSVLLIRVNDFMEPAEVGIDGNSSCEIKLMILCAVCEVGTLLLSVAIE